MSNKGPTLIDESQILDVAFLHRDRLKHLARKASTNANSKAILANSTGTKSIESLLSDNFDSLIAKEEPAVLDTVDRMMRATQAVNNLLNVKLKFLDYILTNVGSHILTKINPINSANNNYSSQLKIILDKEKNISAKFAKFVGEVKKNIKNISDNEKNKTPYEIMQKARDIALQNLGSNYFQDLDKYFDKTQENYYIFDEVVDADLQLIDFIISRAGYPINSSKEAIEDYRLKFESIILGEGNIFEIFFKKIQENIEKINIAEMKKVAKDRKPLATVIKDAREMASTDLSEYFSKLGNYAKDSKYYFDENVQATKLSAHFLSALYNNPELTQKMMQAQKEKAQGQLDAIKDDLLRQIPTSYWANLKELDLIKDDFDLFLASPTILNIQDKTQNLLRAELLEEVNDSIESAYNLAVNKKEPLSFVLNQNSRKKIEVTYDNLVEKFSRLSIKANNSASQAIQNFISKEEIKTILDKNNFDYSSLANLNSVEKLYHIKKSLLGYFNDIDPSLDKLIEAQIKNKKNDIKALENEAEISFVKLYLTQPYQGKTREELYKAKNRVDLIKAYKEKSKLDAKEKMETITQVALTQVNLEADPAYIKVDNELKKLKASLAAIEKEEAPKKAKIETAANLVKKKNAEIDKLKIMAYIKEHYPEKTLKSLEKDFENNSEYTKELTALMDAISEAKLKDVKCSIARNELATLEAQTTVARKNSLISFKNDFVKTYFPQVIPAAKGLEEKYKEFVIADEKNKKFETEGGNYSCLSFLPIEIKGSTPDVVRKECLVAMAGTEFDSPANPHRLLANLATSLGQYDGYTYRYVGPAANSLNLMLKQLGKGLSGSDEPLSPLKKDILPSFEKVCAEKRLVSELISLYEQDMQVQVLGCDNIALPIKIEDAKTAKDAISKVPSRFIIEGRLKDANDKVALRAEHIPCCNSCQGQKPAIFTALYNAWQMKQKSVQVAKPFVTAMQDQKLKNTI